MSKKFTGITSAGSAIPVYDKDAHSALQNKADVSALTAYQPVGDYYSASNPSGFLTAVPAEYATSGDLEDLSTAIAETFQPQSAMTAYLTAVPEGYATTEDLESATSGLQEKGDYYSASNPSGFITGVDLTPYQTIEGMSAYQEKSDMTAYQPVGEYYSASNPSGFITGVDLTPYQEKSAMTAYQTVEDMSAYQPSGDYLTAVPDTYLQNTDLSTTDGKITAISGLPLSAGGDVPEGVMSESGLGFNAVNEISGYNGSAIAQYGAEKQWLTHDDTIVHVSNSAQYALGVNVPVVSQQMNVDRTLLWSGTPNATGYNMTLSENLNNYDRFEVVWKTYARYYVDTLVANSTAQIIALGHIFANNDGNYEKSITTWATTDGLTYNWKATIHGSFTGNQSNNWNSDVVPLKIYGIGRKN